MSLLQNSNGYTIYSPYCNDSMVLVDTDTDLDAKTLMRYIDPESAMVKKALAKDPNTIFDVWSYKGHSTYNKHQTFPNVQKRDINLRKNGFQAHYFLL